MVNPLLLIAPLVFSVVNAKLNTYHEWKFIDYVWASENEKQNAIAEGNYNFTQVTPIDVDVDKEERVFVTTPRFQATGVPATLSTVSDKHGEGGPLLKPYPNWGWHRVGNCDSITSVFRVQIDKCGKLWVLDTGRNGEEQICPAQLLAFDLKTDKLVERIKIPSTFSQNKDNSKGLLITPLVETHGRYCEHVTAYMADTDGYGLVVYNGRGIKRYSDESFKADPKSSNFTIEGESFHLTDGLFSLAMRTDRHSKTLFYRPLASRKQHYVSTEDFSGNLETPDRPDFKTIDYTFPSQVSVQAFTRHGVMLMGLTDPPAILCWDSHKPMNDKNVVIVARDRTTLQFTSGMKIKGNELWVMTNRFQKIMAGTQNFEETNFRIVVGNVDNLIRCTPCDREGSRHRDV